MTKRATIVAFLGMSLALFASPLTASALEAGGAETCQYLDNARVEALFLGWGDALRKTPDAVTDLYATNATLLPTVENGPYTTHAQIKGYFVHFLANHPFLTYHSGIIVNDCKISYYIGLYTFATNKGPVKARYTFIYGLDNQVWKIVHHHSSKQPVDTPIPVPAHH
jgi:hypothetical protein